MSIKVRILKGGIDLIGDATEKFIDELGDGMLERSRRLVPKRTFALHDALEKETERNGNETVTRVGINQNARGGTPGSQPPRVYGPLVERGTSRAPAQPYLMPALLQTIGTVK